MFDKAKKLGLSDLLDQDLSSYEFFKTLPENIQRQIEQEDISSFDELQKSAERIRHYYN